MFGSGFVAPPPLKTTIFPRPAFLKCGITARLGSNTPNKLMSSARRHSSSETDSVVAGGGGRGMRIAHNDISLVKGYHTSRSEAEKAFGNSGVYIEKFI